MNIVPHPDMGQRDHCRLVLAAAVILGRSGIPHTPHLDDVPSEVDRLERALFDQTKNPRRQ